ncbi:MAG: hypothetical protein GWO26_28545, partial [Phycisphaerae bacterium]|nr:hypothetical protein [Phycisphaerae bacterium]
MNARKINLKKIRQEIRRRGLRWSAGKTALIDLPVSELRRKLGWRLPDERTRRRCRQRILRFRRKFAYTSSFDWREYEKADWTTPIRDQGNCGSCVAFGVVATMECQWNIQNNKSNLNADLSEAHLFFCGGSCGCSFGWWVPPALTYAEEHGVSTESCFPYQDHDMPCELCKNWEKKSVRIDKWKEITGVAQRKKSLAKHGPLVGCMDVYEDFTTYTGGVYQHATGERLGGHCISIV